MTVTKPAPVPVYARARWSVLASTGLFCVAAGAALLLAAIAIFGLESENETPLLLGVITLGVVVGFLVRRFGWWAKVLGIVAGLASIMMLFWTAFALGAVKSFFDFMPAILVVPGALMAIGFSIAALVAGRRGNRTIEPTGREHSTIRVVLGVLAAAAVVSGVLTVVTRSKATSVGASETVTLKSFEFDEASYTVPGGSKVFVRNDDPFLHTFTVDALQIDQQTGAGGKYILKIPAKPGEYVLYCKLHTSDSEKPSKDDMAAKLIVE
jgi:plastocyanin